MENGKSSLNPISHDIKTFNEYWDKLVGNTPNDPDPMNWFFDLHKTTVYSIWKNGYVSGLDEGLALGYQLGIKEHDDREPDVI